MKIQTNLSDYKQQQLEPVPAGTYDTEIVGVDEGSASTGTPYLSIEMKIDEPACVGRHVWANVFLTDAARWKLAQLISAAGLELTDELDTEDLLGRQIRIKVREITDQDGLADTEVHSFRRPKAGGVRI